MKKRELLNLGFPPGPWIGSALAACGAAANAGRTAQEIRAAVEALLADPSAMRDDPIYGEVAKGLARPDPETGNYAFHERLT